MRSNYFPLEKISICPYLKVLNLYYKILYRILIKKIIYIEF